MDNLLLSKVIQDSIRAKHIEDTVSEIDLILAGKAGLADDNTFTGKVVVPTPTAAGEAANMDFVINSATHLYKHNIYLTFSEYIAELETYTDTRVLSPIKIITTHSEAITLSTIEAFLPDAIIYGILRNEGTFMCFVLNSYSNDNVIVFEGINIDGTESNLNYSTVQNQSTPYLSALTDIVTEL